MKQCPRCSRTYADETLSFCLEDGGLLSAAYDPDETVVRRVDDSVVRPTEPSYRPDQSIATSVLPRVDTSPYDLPAAHPQKSIAPHLIYAVAGLLGIVIIAGIVGGAIWLTASGKDSAQNRTIDSNQKNSKVTASPTPTKEVVISNAMGPRLVDTALDGTNLTYYQQPSIDECESACAHNANCKGYAWIKAGTYNPNDAAMCYLVSVVTKTTPAKGHISAVKGAF